MKPVRAHRPDYMLALVIFIILAIGLVMMYSISPALSYKLLGTSNHNNYYFYNQLGNIAAGLLAWTVASQIDYRYWKRWAPALMLLVGLAFVALLIPGLSFAKNGATRWLKLGPASFQPAELLKLTLVLYLASWFEKRGTEIRSWWEGTVPFAIILGVVSIAVVIFQRDMGTMMVVIAAAIGMFYVAGIRIRHLAALLAAMLAAAGGLIVTFPHRVARLTTFLHPSSDPTNAGYHINQALIAIGSGGLFGLGLGKSIQVHGYLPEAANDSIFAIIAEEFGLIGSTLLIVLFGILIYRGFQIARQAPDVFGRLVAAGISLWLLFQTLINIAAMLSLVPLTGIPLPFVSYGGSSLVISLFGAGILLNISKYTVKEVSYAPNSERGRDGWPRVADPGNRRRVKTAR